MTPNVLITHDFCETYGGAERVTAELAAAFPDAPVHAILGRPEVFRRMGIDEGRLKTVFPSNEHLLNHYRRLAPLYMPILAVRSAPDCDVVLSSSYGYAHGFSKPRGARHVCYSHGPLRHLWSMQDDYAQQLGLGAGGRAAFEAYVRYARAMDLRAARSVDEFVTTSPYTAGLIERVYDRPARIVPPPVDVEAFRPSGRDDDGYFVFVGRLVSAYKRPDVAIDPFRTRPNQRLVVVGDGPARGDLERHAPPNVTFRGHLGDDELRAVMQQARGLIFPSVDDFGLVPVEMSACGRPVIAYGRGGALQTVKPGVNGMLVAEQTSAAFGAAIDAFEHQSFDAEEIRAHAMAWSGGRFRDDMRSIVAGVAATA